MKWEASLEGKKLEFPADRKEAASELTPDQQEAMDKAVEAAKIRKRLEMERKRG